MKTHRISSLPLLARCPGSALQEDAPLNAQTVEALVGTAVHRVLTSRISGQPVEPESAIRELPAADLDRIDPNEVDLLCRLGWQCWEKLQVHFPAPQVEVPLDFSDPENHLHLQGHADVLSVIDEVPGYEVRVLDFKTGWGSKAQGHSDQVKGYALAALEQTGAKAAYTSVVHIRSGEAQGEYFTRSELWAWYSALLERLRTVAYDEGPHCRYCPRSASCPALANRLRSVGHLLLDLNGEDRLYSAPADVLASLLEGMKLMEQAIAKGREIIKARLAAADGVLPLSDGRVLKLETQKKRPLIPLLAWEPLASELGEEKLIECCSIHKDQVAQALRDKAPKGQKGLAVSSMLHELDRLGALGLETVEHITVKPNHQAIGVTE